MLVVAGSGGVLHGQAAAAAHDNGLAAGAGAVAGYREAVEVAARAGAVPDLVGAVVVVLEDPVVDLASVADGDVLPHLALVAHPGHPHGAGPPAVGRDRECGVVLSLGE